MSSTIIASSHSTPISTTQPPMNKEEGEAVAALLQLWVPQLKVIKIGKPVSKKRKAVKKPKTSPNPKGSPKPVASTKFKPTPMPARKSTRIPKPNPRYVHVQ